MICPLCGVLQAKLSTGLVGSVYLQIGTDLTALRQGLDFLKKYEPFKYNHI
jgi:hypothetical protein